jgi:hypothetical protein
MFVASKVIPFGEEGSVVEVSGNRWEGGDTKAFHARLRRVFDRSDLEEIKKCLLKYAETVELIHCRYPDMGPIRADWALAMAMAPEWYGDDLSNRIQNSMLVSALLLTVTASIFISPPLEDSESAVFRWLVYVTGACNMLFIMSIMLGVFFIENSMSRAYGESEKFVLIIKFYAYKNASQSMMAIGSALFPILLAIPMWETFKQIDASVLSAVTLAYVVITVYVMIRTSIAARVEQSRRVLMFSSLIDPITSRLLPAFYPPDADMQPVDYAAMYRLHEIELDLV